MPHHDDPSQTVRVTPALTAPEATLLRSLAGAAGAVRRIWPGQPSARSPWLPCAGGCCLLAHEVAGVDPAVWLRFLLREVLDPRSAAARARAADAGLTGGHHLDGEVLLGTGLAPPRPRLLVASGRRVRVVTLDDDLVPLHPVARSGRARPAPTARRDVADPDEPDPP